MTMTSATCARSSLSIVSPCGTNSGNITAAMKRNVTSGTPRTSSMYAMHRPLIAGKGDRRPSASATASGNATANPTVDRRNVNGRPPQNSLGTSESPNSPPRSSVTAAAGRTIHRPSSRQFHQVRTVLAPYRTTNSTQATAGRHCSANG